MHAVFIPSKLILDRFSSTDCLNAFLAKFQINNKVVVGKVCLSSTAGKRNPAKSGESHNRNRKTKPAIHMHSTNPKHAESTCRNFMQKLTADLRFGHLDVAIVQHLSHGILRNRCSTVLK